MCYSDLRDKVGEWNSTSKTEDDYSHGFRGEALAAIRELSFMSITSKTGDSRSTYIKSFNTDNCTIKLSLSTVLQSGSSVKVQQLFSQLPARRKAMKPSTEMLRVKEFMQRMSILNHDVIWLLRDDFSGKTVLKLLPQLSVSARFTEFHGHQVRSLMKVRTHIRDFIVTHCAHTHTILINRPHHFPP